MADVDKMRRTMDGHRLGDWSGHENVEKAPVSGATQHAVKVTISEETVDIPVAETVTAVAEPPVAEVVEVPKEKSKKTSKKSKKSDEE
jgi:hypothetical protein